MEKQEKLRFLFPFEMGTPWAQEEGTVAGTFTGAGDASHPRMGMGWWEGLEMIPAMLQTSRAEQGLIPSPPSPPHHALHLQLSTVFCLFVFSSSAFTFFSPIYFLFHNPGLDMRAQAVGSRRRGQEGTKGVLLHTAFLI